MLTREQAGRNRAGGGRMAGFAFGCAQGAVPVQHTDVRSMRSAVYRRGAGADLPCVRFTQTRLTPRRGAHCRARVAWRGIAYPRRPSPPGVLAGTAGACCATKSFACGRSRRMQRATMQRATMQRATMQRATMQRATMQRVTMQRATMQRSRIQRTGVPLQHAPCGHATCRPRRAASDVRNATCGVRRAACDVRRAQCNVHNATCTMRRAACAVRRPTCGATSQSGADAQEVHAEVYTKAATAGVLPHFPAAASAYGPRAPARARVCPLALPPNRRARTPAPRESIDSACARSCTGTTR
jgi:hypothetical protein